MILHFLSSFLLILGCVSALPFIPSVGENVELINVQTFADKLYRFKTDFEMYFIMQVAHLCTV